jgi:hypothetical protein
MLGDSEEPHSDTGVIEENLDDVVDLNKVDDKSFRSHALNDSAIFHLLVVHVIFFILHVVQSFLLV